MSPTESFSLTPARLGAFRDLLAISQHAVSP